MFVQFRRLAWKASLLATLVGMLAFTVVLAAPGDLDTTFSGDGKVTSFALPTAPSRDDISWSVVVQPDGKIVAAGYNFISGTNTSDFAVIRHNSDGGLDTSFSGDGRLVTNFGGRDLGFEAALQSNGKIVVAGETCNASNICNLALARYNVGGALDTTFSGDGKQITDFGGNDNGSIGGLAIQSNGKIVVAGFMWNGSNYDFAIHRYLSDGNLDSTFSADGRQSIGFGSGRQDFAVDLVVQADGKIVVGGYSGDSNYNNNNFAIVRLTAGGALDTTFNGTGRVITNIGADDYAYDVALQADGKIILAGEKFIPPPAFQAVAMPRHEAARRMVEADKNPTVAAAADTIALARYNTNGSLDTTFNSTGIRVFSIVTNADSWAEGLVAQDNGKIVLLATTDNGFGNLNYGLVRLNSGGGFDTTFSGDGKVVIDFGNDEFAGDLAVQADGKYVLGGYTRSTQRDFAIARVLP